MNRRLRRSRKLTWAEGLEIVPGEDLPTAISSLIDEKRDSFAVHRAGGRRPPLLIDAEAATLLQGFRRPATIVEAVIDYSKNAGVDPRTTLADVYPVLERLIAKRFLVWAEGSDQKTAASGPVVVGAWLEDLEVLRSVQQMEDTAVYQVRLPEGRFAALKIRQPESSEGLGSLEHEAEILHRLGGRPAPKLLRTGVWHGLRYLLLEWCEGSDATTVPEEWRLRADARSSDRLLVACRRIAEAYAILHQRGVIHGDVHPRNVLVDRENRVRLVDFGLARWIADETKDRESVGRGGIPFFFDPEYARSLLSGGTPPPQSVAGEQYALAALLYQVFTGVPYVDFEIEWEATLGQILEDPPIPFAARGVLPWPEVEAALDRALAKKPERRFPSTDDFFRVLVQVSPRSDAKPTAGVRRRKGPLDRLVDDVLEKARLDGPWLTDESLPAPQASVYHGGAGIALALYRMARQRSEDDLLSLAEAWALRSGRELNEPGAFDHPEDEVATARVEEGSPLFGPSGVFAVQVLIGSALGKPGLYETATESFIRQSASGLKSLDLTHGCSGALQVSALLVDALPEDSCSRRHRLAALGRDLLAELEERLCREAPLNETLGSLGMAHGWAGRLYAILQWCRVSGASSSITHRLPELSDLAQPAGRGLIWPWRIPLANDPGPDFMAGWCHGSAGYVLLWTLAAEVLSEPAYLDLGLAAGWTAWESAQREGSLCCGLVGRAYALLRLYRATGKGIWLDRARDLACLAAAKGHFDDAYPHSLFKGELGLALLAEDLERPDSAVFPFFEVEN